MAFLIKFLRTLIAAILAMPVVGVLVVLTMIILAFYYVLKVICFALVFFVNLIRAITPKSAYGQSI